MEPRTHVGARLREGWRERIDPAWLEGWLPAPLDLGGETTEAVVLGQGPDLLLLPPLPGYKEAFLGVAAMLARSFRVITFDLRTRFRGAPSWEQLLADLERVADQLAPRPSIVLGHSLGGALAQRWALARPDRVRALILSSSFARVGTPPGQLWKRFVEQPLVLATQRFLPEAVADRCARAFAGRGAWVLDPRCDARVLGFVRHGIRGLGLGEARACVRLALAHDVRDRLGSLSLPTLVVVGERETAFGRAGFEELARLLPHAERRIAPGVSHLHPLSSPEWLVRTACSWALGFAEHGSRR